MTTLRRAFRVTIEKSHFKLQRNKNYNSCKKVTRQQVNYLYLTPSVPTYLPSLTADQLSSSPKRAVMPPSESPIAVVGCSNLSNQSQRFHLKINCSHSDTCKATDTTLPPPFQSGTVNRVVLFWTSSDHRS